MSFGNSQATAEPPERKGMGGLVPILSQFWIDVNPNISRIGAC